MERVLRKEYGGESAAKTGFEHANYRVLLGDDLGLPNQDDGHDAHGKNAKRENNAGLRFCGRNAKYAANPIHGKGPSPGEPERYTNKSEGQFDRQRSGDVLEPSVLKFSGIFCDFSFRANVQDLKE